MSSEKILILTEFFPPYNNTGANRPFSWAKYLHKFGYYPIIFCRNFFREEQYKIERFEFFEVHYIQCKDHYFQQKRMSKSNVYFRRFFGFLNYIFENSISYNPINKLFAPVSKYISQNGIEKMIVTAPSYSIFGLADKLFKKHSIKWIADYRDDWTSSELFSTEVFKLINKIDVIREKKYLNSCKCFTTVSDFYIQKIKNVINKKGFLIENGFEPTEIEEQIYEPLYNKKLQILYPGTIYSTQKLKIVVEALEILPENIITEIEIIFLGTEVKSTNLPTNGYKFLNKSLFFMKRFKRSKALDFLKQADLFLLITHSNKNNEPIKGIPSSKLYEFINFKKRVLVCPTDKDIIEKKLTETHQAVFCNTAEELASKIIEFYLLKKQLGCVPIVEIHSDTYTKNTREFQSMRMAKVLDSL